MRPLIEGFRTDDDTLRVRRYWGTHFVHEHEDRPTGSFLHAYGVHGSVCLLPNATS